MENSYFFLHYLIEQRKIIIIILGIFLILGTLVTVIHPFEYSSTTRVLIIHKINPNLDAYTAARAAEKLTQNLSTIIYSSSFLDTLNTSYNINLPKDERQRRQAWKNKIAVTVEPSTSILEIRAYDKNREDAPKLAYLVANTLITQGKEYHGGGQDVVIKLLDKPLTSRFPTRPNIVFNLLSSLVLGLIFAYFVALRKYYLHFKHR
jgi:capsular polysaccharide biosynthesis protein